VDNLTHSLVGLAAAKAGLERKSPYATAVCVVAANLPDIDIVTLVKGPSAYLANHRGITHSIVGTLALGLIFPALFFAGERAWARLRGRAARARFKGLLVCSLLLIISHPLLDWTNNYGWRPLLPWDGRWIYGDLLFVLDPWVWMILGGACFLLTAQTRRRAAVWTLLALVLTLLLFLFPRRFGTGMPPGVYVLWLAGLSAIFVLHRTRAAARREASVASAALALVLVYCGTLALFHARAYEEARGAAQSLVRQDGEKVLRLAAMPVLADPFTWRCLAETDRATFRFDLPLDARGRYADARDLLRIEKPAGAEAELAARASANEQARVLLDFARFPVVRLRRNDGGASFVQFADLRFTEPGSRPRPGSFSLEVPVGP
jgi:inner membrane protein